jgi:alkanesulfonate monooxygenase SsuD/methylene tetrahydromethanopterin reductase-like flavin-dependent oxidoreductase (luciferase family)
MTSPDLTPRLGIHLANFSNEDLGDWSGMIDLARAADANGIDKVVVSDHVVMGEHLDEYGKPEVGGVRGPVVLAKSLSTLDVLSNGRVDIGIGVGWQKEEYDAAGLDFSTRGRTLDETIGILQTLWRSQSASYEVNGQTVSGIHQMPKPRQAGGVPIWVSGTLNKKVADRLAKYGSGWIPWGDAAVDLTASIPALWQMVEAAGGDPTGLRVVGNIAVHKRDDRSADVAASIDALAPQIAAGVTDFMLRVPLPSAAAAADIFAEWSSAFRAATGRR